RYLNDPEYRKSILGSRKRNRTAPKAGSTGGGAAGRDWRKWAWYGAGGSALFLIIFLLFLIQGLPTFDELENPRTDNASLIMSRDGVILDRFFTENRTVVHYDEISPFVIDALVSTEDHRFEDHWGIDLVRLAA